MTTYLEHAYLLSVGEFEDRLYRSTFTNILAPFLNGVFLNLFFGVRNGCPLSNRSRIMVPLKCRGLKTFLHSGVLAIKGCLAKTNSERVKLHNFFSCSWWRFYPAKVNNFKLTNLQMQKLFLDSRDIFHLFLL